MTKVQLILNKTFPVYSLEPVVEYDSLVVWNPVDVPVGFEINARDADEAETDERRLVHTTIPSGKHYRVDALLGQAIREQQAWGAVVDFRLTSRAGICQITLKYEEPEEPKAAPAPRVLRSASYSLGFGPEELAEALQDRVKMVPARSRAAKSRKATKRGVK